MTPVPEETFTDFGARLGVHQRRIPIEGTIETTYRCNLRCAHCYVNEPVGSREEWERELPLARLKGLVDEIVEAGTLFLLFTGGEILVRPEFPELYVYALEKGLLVTVFTNGTLVTEEIADLFDEHRPDRIEVSLYGLTKETYERVTRIPGSFEKCRDGIDRLVRRGVPLTLKTMALTWNQHEVLAMEAYARSLGLDFRFDSLLNPRVDCGANRNGELQLDPEQAVALDLGSPERLRDLREFCERFTRPDAVYDADHVYTCGAGRSSFTVDPYGQLQMCQLSRKHSVDLRTASFDEGWNNVFPKLRALTWQKNDVCRRCSLLALCGSCAGANEMENGDPEVAIPAFCEITHLRAHAAMGEASGHRRDASCCLGRGGSAAPTVGGCGSCGAAPEPPLIQLGRRPERSRP